MAYSNEIDHNYDTLKCNHYLLFTFMYNIYAYNHLWGVYCGYSLQGVGELLSNFTHGNFTLFFSLLFCYCYRRIYTVHKITKMPCLDTLIDPSTWLNPIDRSLWPTISKVILIIILVGN